MGAVAGIILSAVLSGLIAWKVAKGQVSRQLKAAQLQGAWESASMALDDYMQWLADLRHLADPVNWQPPDKLTDKVPTPTRAGHLDLVLTQLRGGASTGVLLLKALQNARYDLAVDDEFLGRLERVVSNVKRFWDRLDASLPPTGGPSMNAFDVNIRLLARDSLDLGRWDAREVQLAERVVGDTRHALHREYKRATTGSKAIKHYEASVTGVNGRLVKLQDGVLRHHGDVPFERDDYLAAMQMTPWEREATAKAEAGQPPPRPDARENDTIH